MILHYMHYGSQWFYWFDQKTKKKYWKQEMSSDISWLPSNIRTEKECRNFLQETYPNYTMQKAYPYHIGTKIDKNGSRPNKITVDRKGMLKEKRDFMQKLTKEKNREEISNEKNGR